MRPSLLLVACAAMAAVSASSTEPPAAQTDGNQSGCWDFAGRPGTCGPIQRCPHLLELISGSRRPTVQEIANLRRSRCGDAAGQVLLCCAPGPAVPFAGEPEEHPNRAVLEAGHTNCGLAFQLRISGGTAVRMGAHAWLAVLGYARSSSEEVTFECGGALISDQHVLTAAHCVSGLPSGLQLKSVRLGEHNLTQATDCRTQPDGEMLCNNPQDFQIAELFIHDDYQKPAARMNDIALLKLDRPAVMDAFVGKICLPFGAARLRNYTGVDLTVVGFGRVGAADGPPSAVPLQVTLAGLDQERCAAAIGRLGGTLGPRQLCAGAQPGRDICFGDSGSPLIAPGQLGPPYSLVGITAYGDRSCQGGAPAVFTRVAPYLNWILDRVGD